MTMSEVKYRLLIIAERRERATSLKAAINGIKYKPVEFRKIKVETTILSDEKRKAIEKEILLAQQRKLKEFKR